MANSWMKLYHETLNDPKMGTMSDHLYRRCIELFLLAGQTDQGGMLPPVPQMAWALRTTVQDMTLCLQELSELGIISKDAETGCFLVTHFAERQESNLSGAERVAKYREKRAERYECNADDVTGVTEMKRSERYTCNADCNADANADANADDVSNGNGADVTNVTLDKDKDKEEDKDKDKDLINTASAKADRGAGKRKADPADPDFWKRAFGPHAEMAQAFSRASGIVPIGSEFGRWQKDLKAFAEAGISIEQMTRAVTRVRMENRYPIKAPGSVLTVARNLAAKAARLDADAPVDYLEGVTWEGADA